MKSNFKQFFLEKWWAALALTSHLESGAPARAHLSVRERRSCSRSQDCERRSSMLCSSLVTMRVFYFMRTFPFRAQIFVYISISTLKVCMLRPFLHLLSTLGGTSISLLSFSYNKLQFARRLEVWMGRFSKGEMRCKNSEIFHEYFIVKNDCYVSFH